MHKSQNITLEFHVSRQAREKYQFDQSLFSLTGNVILANFHAARVFAQKMNQKRDLILFPEQAVKAGQINAMGLIDEILHYVIRQYREEKNPQVMEQALAYLNTELGEDAVDRTLRAFVDQFPNLTVYRREIGLTDYLNGETSGVQNRQIVLEELLLLWLANANPGFSPFLELFDDTDLELGTVYSSILSGLHQFFENQPQFGPDHQNLIDMLRSPAINSPYSLAGQLDFIRQRWGSLLASVLFRLLSSLDFIQEEEKAIFGGPGPARVVEFIGLEKEIERFSPDKDWMPSCVVLAKNAFVWLDQLSKQYQRPIHRLDQIPDFEIEKIGQWGFGGLWLIGLWERSAASQRIKQLRGNPDAVASAYSLYDYQIAADLGGEEAYENLRDRAWKQGVRLASDMVPNHMGIDSRWVIEHPDWFVSLDYSPFPAYSFNGPNLSGDNRVGIYLEDHYYDSSDASVVFMRVDHWTGSTRFIYHGNDGTSFPWNDTAQLNFLIPEVREAVIQTILHVARKFPIIRFDAAMTLAKKHFQRLWFPEPGTGGAIPTRAEHGLTRDQFDSAFPIEFWREVVDRVAQEVPDTLLLAEAFWLMEGYFVRTLGMHRVYNSAFMNMLRDEKNQEYRLVIKNTLEFDPEILKRYVNFMNNPDERTAVDQFGKGDKYFGTCTLMATLPGLPMFGHGQIEGFTEKYGMEFRRALWDETPDPYLIERHEREIFPLLRRRYLFAEARDFLLYDFYSIEGSVNEDVFAYSNRAGDERALVIYHNRYADARGWIRESAAYSVKIDSGDERNLVRKSLGDGLSLHNDENYFVIFRDHVSGLEYIRSSHEIHQRGLYIELGAYKYHVFLDFREVKENEWRQYSQLAAYLSGRGVPSVDEAIKEIFLQPIHYPFRELVNADLFQRLDESRLPSRQGSLDVILMSEVEQKAARLYGEINEFIQAGRSKDEIESFAANVLQEIEIICQVTAPGERFLSLKSKPVRELVQSVYDGLKVDEEEDKVPFGILIGWAMTHALGRIVGETDYPARSRSWLDEYLFGKLLFNALVGFGLDEADAWKSVGIVKVLTNHQDWYDQLRDENQLDLRVVSDWLEDGEIQRFLKVNRYQGILWFNHESFVMLLQWMVAIVIIDTLADPQVSQVAKVKTLTELKALYTRLKSAELKSEYRVEKLLEELKGYADFKTQVRSRK